MANSRLMFETKLRILILYRISLAGGFFYCDTHIVIVVIVVADPSEQNIWSILIK